MYVMPIFKFGVHTVVSEFLFSYVLAFCRVVRCAAAKGEGASECNKFAKYYRSLCPGEWVS